MASVFVPSKYKKLHNRLTDALSRPSETRASKSNDWFVSVDRLKSSLVDLGRVKPQNDTERKQIESGEFLELDATAKYITVETLRLIRDGLTVCHSGSIIIDGKSEPLNADFAQHTLLLARSLRVSEQYAASLLQAGLSGRARYGQGALEVACILHHYERIELLSCLKLLVESYVFLQHSSDSRTGPLRSRLQQLLNSLLAVRVETELQSGPKRKVGLVERMLIEIDELHKYAQHVQADLQGSAQTLQPQSNQASSLRLTDEIQLERQRWIQHERRELGHILYLLAIARMLSEDAIIQVTNWLAHVSPQLESDAVVVYVLSSLLGALDTAPEPGDIPQFDDDSRASLQHLLASKTFITTADTAITSQPWPIRGLQNVARLQWSLFLAEAFKQNPSLGTELRRHQQGLQALVIGAINGDERETNGAFVYLVLHVLAFRRRIFDQIDGNEDELLHSDPLIPGSRKASSHDLEEIDPEFQNHVLDQIERQILGVTSVMLPYLRRLQRSEEDAAFASSRSASGVVRTGVSVSGRKYDIEALFDVVALLCRDRPEAALPFWTGPDGRQSRFLSWAVDVREQGHQRALLDMLQAMAMGPTSAWQAHSLLSAVDDADGLDAGASGDGRLASWSNLFDWIQYYIDSLRPSANQGASLAPRSTSDVPAGMLNEEVQLLCSFLRLLRNVVLYSEAARLAIYENTSFSAIPRLFGLYASQAHGEVKAALLDALAAFAQPSRSGSPSGTATTIRVVAELWEMLDKANVLGQAARNSGRAFTSASHGSGAYYELETTESAMRSYPSTTSFVNLLKALVYLPGRIHDPAGLLASPAALGLEVGSAQPASSVANFPNAPKPRLEPYISFVIDGCLLQAGQREYANPSERWKVTAACLGFIERTLRAYDLSPLLAQDRSGGPSSENLRTLVLHPGFSVMRRILSGGKVLAEILSVVNPGGSGGSATSASFEIINSTSSSTIFYATCVRHTLRIVQRIFRLQDLFLQVLLPSLSDASAENVQIPVDLQLKLGESGSLSPIDAHLLVHHQVVVQTALLVKANRTDVALLAVRVLHSISRSTAFRAEDRFSELSYRRKMNRLVGLLEMSDESERVCAAFAHRLDPSSDTHDGRPEEVAQSLLDGDASDEDDPQVGADQLQVANEMDEFVGSSHSSTDALRNTILNLLVSSTTIEQASPNLAHLLLGYDIRTSRPEEQTIADPLAPDATPSSLHAVLELLDVGNVSDPDETTTTVAERNPALAERCFALVHNLCIHPYTSAATLRYLRTREDFFVRQIRALAMDPSDNAYSKRGAAGLVIYADGRAVPSTVDFVVASLRCRMHLLEGTALELHALSNAGMESRAARLVAALCGTSPSGFHADQDDDEDLDVDVNLFVPGSSETNDVGDSGMILLRLLQSFDFDWKDERDSLRSQLSVLASLQVHGARVPDGSSTVREYDLSALLAILIAERHRRSKRGELIDAVGRSAFMRDSEAILHIACAHNAQRAITSARRDAMKAWRHALDMILSRSARILGQSSRALMLFDCLSALLPRLVGPTPETDPVLAELITGSVLSLLTALRQYRLNAGSEVSEVDPLDVFPTDKLVAVARALVEALLRPGSSALSRGNLYSALINYLNLVRSGPTDTAVLGQETASILGSERDDTFSIDDSSSRFGANSPASLEARTYALLSSSAERLLPIIARDALNGQDIWRTLAFTLLDKLCVLDVSPAGLKGQRFRATELLDRQGFLKSFVAALRDMDIALQDVVRPDPASLNPLYIYTSQLAFFNRIAQTKEGSDRLLDAKLFEVLAQADFLATRPERGQDFVDIESFLPAATERYNALLTPALQLAVAVLSSAAARGPVLKSTNYTSASYSPSSHGAPRQAMAFLSAHRDTFLQLLKEPTFDTISLASIEQAQLMTSVLALVLPSLEDDALVAPHPFAAFHSAVLNLAGAFLYKAAWTSRVVPYTDDEIESSQSIAPSMGGGRIRSQLDHQNGEAEDQSIFEVNAADAVRPLVAGLLRYLERASESRGQHSSRIRPVLTASIFAPTGRGRSPFDDSEARFSVNPGRAIGLSGPGLGSTLAALNDNVDDVITEVQSLEVASTLLANPDSVRSEEWDEIMRSIPSMNSSAEVSSALRRRLALHHVRLQKAKLQSDIVFKLDSIEILLVLLYRHLYFYLSLARSNGAAGGSGGRDTAPDVFLHVSRARGDVHGVFGSSEAATLVKDSVGIVDQALESLSGLVQALVAAREGVLHGVVARTGFVEMAARKLQECLSGGDDVGDTL